MKRLVPEQQFQVAPDPTKMYILASGSNGTYSHKLMSDITAPIEAAINNAVMDVKYDDHELKESDIENNSYTFILAPRVPLTSPVEVTVSDANGQSGIVVAHSIAGYGPQTTEGIFGSYAITVTGFADELSVGGSLGILTTWKKVVPAVVPN